MDAEIAHYLLAMLVVFFGAWVQGMIGFGLAVVSAPVLYLVAPQMVPSALICVSFFTALLGLRRYREQIDLSQIKYAIAGRVPGSLLGVLLLSFATRETMSLLIGVSVLLAVLVSLSRINVQVSKQNLLFAGFISGVTGTTSSIGGPPVALVMQNESGDRIRSGMSAYFAFSNLISLAFLAAAGLFGLDDFVMALALLPAILAGNSLSRKLSLKVNQRIIRHMLLLICSFAGVSALASALN
nr:sulfite exporter TauE/SafE family protein [Endozoicomonas sp. OPT23]